VAAETNGDNKSSSAYLRLRELIEAGKLGTGERLTEARAIRLTGFGRGPVRESLLRQEAEGVLKQHSAGRSRIVGIVEDENQQELLARYELREQIESGAARLAAKNMTGWQIDRLRRLAAKVDLLPTSNDDERHRAAAAFHEYLVENCGNPLLIEVWQQYRLAPSRPRFRRTEELINSLIVGDGADNPSWGQVADAIAQHDQDLAESLTKRKVRLVTEALRKIAWGDLSSESIPAYPPAMEPPVQESA
jgi:DNA-binding GntR family transcriptional regulator